MRLSTNQFNIDGGDEGNYTPAASTPAAAPAMDPSDAHMSRMAADRRAAQAAATPPTGPSPLAAQESGAIGAASIASQYGAYKEPGKGAGMKTASKAPKEPKAIDKSNWDRGIKVSQSTVDAVKDAGRGNMGKVPQRTVKNDAIGLSGKGYVGSQMQYNAPVSAEYKEAVKRVYPNEVKSKPSPTFGESSPNAKAFPKVAAPKTSKEKVLQARNKEIVEANKTAKDGKFAAAVINAAKGGAEAYGASTKERYQIPGTQTKTQKAQAAAKAERAAAVKAAAAKKNKK